MLSSARKFWAGIQEPKIVTISHAIGYSLAALAGLGVLIDPPKTVVSALNNSGVVTAWGVIFIVGGVLGSFACLKGIWWIERVGTILSVTGWLIYLSTSIYLQANLGDTSSRYILIPCILVAIVHTAKRWFTIRVYPYDPER